jgi:hypothetical protein
MGATSRHRWQHRCFATDSVVAQPPEVDGPEERAAWDVATRPKQQANLAPTARGEDAEVNSSGLFGGRAG